MEENNNIIELKESLGPINESDENNELIPNFNKFGKEKDIKIELNNLKNDSNFPIQKIDTINIEEEKELMDTKRKVIKSVEEESKKRLTEILDNITQNINHPENKDNNLEEIYKEYLNTNGFVSKKKIKESLKNNDCCLCFIFYIFCPFMTVVNLIGIFQMISVMKILSHFLWKSIKICLSLNELENIESYQFFNNFYSELLKEPVDYNLMMIMGFLGNILLGTIGYRCSSIIFALINTAGFFMIYNFNFLGNIEENEKYNFWQIIYLLLMYIFLLIGVGGSALLSQQILLDSFYKYQHYFENKKKKIDLHFFFIVCFTTILGHFFKNLLNFFLALKFKDEKDDKRLFFLYIYVIYISSIGLSIILYICYGFTFFNKGFCNWLLSLITFCRSDNKENKKKVCMICGYLYYSESRVLDGRLKKAPCCESCKLFWNSIYQCCDKSCCDFICCQENDEDNEDNEEDKYHCCFKCCCPKNIDYRDYEYPKNVSLCYCYKVKRKFKWFNNFINNREQIKLTKLMFDYYILQFTTIAFEKIYKENQQKLIKEGNFIDNILNFKRFGIFFLIYLTTIIIFFYITISWGKYIENPLESIESGGDKQNIVMDDNGLNHKNMTIKVLSKDILKGSFIVLGFNSLFSFIFTIFYYSNNSFFNNLVISENNHYIYIPIFMSKFYYFTFTYYCLKKSEEIKGFDLMSGSTLISIYVSIFSIIFGIIRDYVPLKYIVIIQSIPTVFIMLIFFMQIGANLFCKGIFWRTILYFFFYFFAFGGLWFFGGCCCKCCECFETKEKFNKCCDCGRFNDCCKHKECSEKCNIFEIFEKCKKLCKKKKKRNSIVPLNKN